jgi:hypothetical protein
MVLPSADQFLVAREGRQLKGRSSRDKFFILEVAFASPFILKCVLLYCIFCERAVTVKK